MKRPYYLILFFLISGLVYFQSCTSGKRAYERGDYYQSVLKAVERLRKNSNHKKSRETLKTAYPLALQYYKTEISDLQNSGKQFKWGGIVAAYERINHMAEEIRRSPGALRVIRNPDRYASKLQEAKNNAAEEAYEAGVRLINPNNRENSREAYFLLRKANNYVNGYKDVRTKMAEAKEYATLKVIIEQIPVRGKYSISAKFFQEKVEEFLQTGIRNEFVRFFTPRDTRRYQDADQIISLYFDDFVVGNVATSKETIEYTKDSVEVGETVVNRQKVPVYGTVKAKLTTIRAEVISNGLLAMKVLDARSESIITSDRLPGSFVWFVEWASFNGDERALTKEQLKLCKLGFVPPPPAQDLFIEFTKPIYDQLTVKLQKFYSRY